MGPETYPGITRFATFWADAPMVRHTFDAFVREADAENDAVIDAAKGMVECACRTVIHAVQGDMVGVLAREKTQSLPTLQEAAVTALRLDDTRDAAFDKLVKSLHEVGKALMELRNKAGPLSHGKDGFLNSVSPGLRLSAVSAADAIITVLLEGYFDLEVDLTHSQLPYEQFEDRNRAIDEGTNINALDTPDPGTLEVSLTLPNGEATLKIPLSKLLFDNDRVLYGAVLEMVQAEMAANLNPEMEDNQ